VRLCLTGTGLAALLLGVLVPLRVSAADPPTITSFAPDGGRAPGGTVTIQGTNFTGATEVRFNTAPSTRFFVVSAITINADVPAGATTGPISVTTPAGTATSATVFTVADPPVVTGFTPTSGPVGTTVTINGQNFTGTRAVFFPGFVTASFSEISDSTIQAIVPGGTNDGLIAVRTAGGTANSPSAFTVQGAPKISGFTPDRVPIGASVTINGTNLAGATSVTFDKVSASYTVISDTSIQATVPAGVQQGYVPVFVTTPGGKTPLGVDFRVTGPPVIGTLSPAFAPVGASVSLEGSDLTGATAVAFNGLSASFTVASDALIQATVPEGATSGRITVTTPLGTGTSRQVFTVTARLLATKTGNGSGTVFSTSSPRNPVTIREIACGGLCDATYAVGAVVTLTTVAAGGSELTGWDGCDAVSGTTCTVTMNEARTVTATFSLQRFPLNVTKSSTLGVGDGTVSSTSSPDSPDQIDCGPTCSVDFDYGTVVTLTATPGLASMFDGWSGCDQVSGAICSVSVTQERTVSAHFLP
jgi:hypothetical protein